MSRPIQALISRRAIAHNLAVVRRIAPDARVWAVMKADAYGHGLNRVAEAGSPALAGADGVAILETETAQQLRDLGWGGPILLLEGCFDASDLDAAMRLGVTVTVHDDEQIAMIEAARIGAPLQVYLKMNTGMNRLGFAPARFRSIHERLRKVAGVGTITLTTHFANADRPDGVGDQLAVFERGAARLQGPRSLANSAAILAHLHTHHDWVRPGIMLYGASPFATRGAAEFGLQAAMQLESRLIAVQHLQAGEGIGYGHRYAAEREMRIGVVACGYADGYPRVAPNGTPIAVAGVRTRVVGRVSMDMLTVDLTPIPQANVGSHVELWGSNVPVDDVAQAAGTVGYELLCAVAPRVPVVTID
ncbi:MAG: alanine racemase [Burkholderiaceae bacterium]